MGWESDYRAELEAEGPEWVRLRLQLHLIIDPYFRIAFQWLREKEAEAAGQAETERARTFSEARWANVRDTAAAVAAIIAAVAAIVGAYMSYLSYVSVR